MQKNKLNILLLVIYYIILNIIILPYILNKKYHFINSIFPYFFDADSFYYLSNTTLVSAYIIAFLLPILSICLFYLICSKEFKSKYSFLASLGLMTFPNFFNQMYISNYDMQKFISLIFIVILGGILLFKDNKFKNYFKGSMFIIIGCILIYIWTGAYVIYASILFGLIFGFTKGILRIFIILCEVTAGLYFFKDRFLNIIILKYYTVIEYSTPKYIFYYIIFIFMVIFFIKYYKNKDYKSKVLFGITFFMFLFSLLVGRFSLFCIILIFFMLVKMDVLNNKYIRMALISMIIINIIFMVISYNNTAPNINQDEELMLKNCFNENYPIISYWYNGYIIDYFTDNEVIFKATPIPLRDTSFNSAIISGDIKYFDNIYSGRYYLYFKDIDTQKIPNIYKYDLISEVLNTSVLPGFKTVCYDGKRIVLLRNKHNNTKLNNSYYLISDVQMIEEVKEWV